MLNANIEKRVTKTEVHEWVVGTESEPSDTKTFNWALGQIHKQMEALGIDLGMDDAYHVRAGDGGEVVFYATVKKGKLIHAELQEAGTREKVAAALELHREGHNEETRQDSWPSGHCNYDGDDWPCATARALGVIE